MLTTYAAILTAKSPLIHGADEKAGTDTLFRRQRMVTADGIAEVPILSGNAIRGRLRRVAAERFCTLLELPERSLAPWIYYSLFAGGSIAKGSAGGKLGIGDRRAIRENVPHLSLMGCAWKADILQGKLLVSHAIPICRETVEFTGVPADRSMHELGDEWALTRKDDRESDWFAAVEDVAGSNNGSAVQMQYRVEVLAPGTRLAVRFVLDDANAIEAACFGDTVRTWLEHPTLGGRASGGFGLVGMTLATGELPDPGAYLAHLADNRPAILEWLLGR